MEEYYNKIKNSKIYENIQKEGDYTVVLTISHKDRAKYALYNTVYLLAPLGYTFNVLYKNEEDISEFREKFKNINWLHSVVIDNKILFRLQGKPKKVVFLDTHMWLNNDIFHTDNRTLYWKEYLILMLGEKNNENTSSSLPPFFDDKNTTVKYLDNDISLNDGIFRNRTLYWEEYLFVSNLISREKSTENISSLSFFGDKNPTVRYLDYKYILDNILELGFITSEGKILPPKEIVHKERLQPTIDFIDKIIKKRGTLKKDYYFTLFDGWREWTEPSDKKIFVNCTESLLENFIYEKGRFIKNVYSEVPDCIYPKFTYDVLSYCRHKEDSTVVLIPDADFLKSKGYIELKKEIDSKNIPLSEKKNIIYWRGNRTGIGYRRYSKQLYSQRELCVMLKYDYLDSDFSIDTDKGDFLRNKFLLDIDGEVNAWSGLFWKLYSGSIVLKVESHWEQWYYNELKPWIHYVPVAGDLSDLPNIYNILTGNPELCEKISKNGRDFAEKLTLERAIDTIVF